jgi:hypothetical protein
MFEGEISNRDQHDVEADDDEGADGYVGDYRVSEAIKDLTTVQHTKKKKYVDGVEEGDVWDVLACIEGFQMPGKEQNACQKTSDAASDIPSEIALSE